MVSFESNQVKDRAKSRNPDKLGLMKLDGLQKITDPKVLRNALKNSFKIQGKFPREGYEILDLIGSQTINGVDITAPLDTVIESGKKVELDSKFHIKMAITKGAQVN